MNVLDKIETDGLIFDGAMGSMLIEKGLTGSESPELWNLTRPDVILSIHQAYFEAGADVATANTFGATSLKLKKMGVDLDMADINRAGVEIARKACGPDQYVAADMGELGDMLQPMGPISPEDARTCFSDQAKVLDRCGADFFIIETAFDINLALAAVEGIQSVSSKPVFCSLTFNEKEKGFFTIFGNRPGDSMKTLVDAGVSVVGANCSMGSDVMIKLAARIRQSVDVPVIVQPNAGLPQVGADNGVFYPEDETFFAENMKKIKELGVEVLGGCCGTTPAYIRKMKEIL